MFSANIDKHSEKTQVMKILFSLFKFENESKRFTSVSILCTLPSTIVALMRFSISSLELFLLVDFSADFAIHSCFPPCEISVIIKSFS